MDRTPIVYVHGVAVRDKQGRVQRDKASHIFDHLLSDIAWPTVESNLRTVVAPVISTDPTHSKIIHAYWGDLGAHLGWTGASYLSKDAEPHQPFFKSFASLFRSQIVADIRPPLDHIIALFIGDVFCYLSNRGDSKSPGAIPTRVMNHLLDAQRIKNETGEPLVVLSNSMGCEIVYDIVTYFLPNVTAYGTVKIDYWCGVASQVGLFEELKLFLSSSDEYGGNRKNRVPFPNSDYLGCWWNVWDPDDILSYSVRDIIEGVDDSRYVVGKSLFNEHLGYLQEKRFYRTLATWIESKMPSR